MDIDEQAILAFKEMADKKILGFFESRDSAGRSPYEPLTRDAPSSPNPFREWMNGLGIRDFSFEWTCVQFLDPDHVMVKVQGQKFSDVRGAKCYFADFCLLVPKDIVKKSLVLGELP